MRNRVLVGVSFSALVWLSLLVSAETPPSLGAQAADAPIQAMIKGFKEREKRIRSARFKWTQQVTQMKETLPGGKSGKRRLYPAADVTHEVKCEEAVQGW